MKKIAGPVGSGIRLKYPYTRYNNAKKLGKDMRFKRDIEDDRRSNIALAGGAASGATLLASIGAMLYPNKKKKSKKRKGMGIIRKMDEDRNK